jgi:hypothetical protein
MSSNDKQILQDALRKQNLAVTTSTDAARALLMELGLLTKSGKLKKSVTPRSITGVSR